MEELKYNFINLNNHKTVVLIGENKIELKGYKRTPRVEYEYETNLDYPEFGLNAIAARIKNLPFSYFGVNLIVSRECLRAMNEIARRLLQREGLKVWLDENRININKKFRIPYRILGEKWAEFKQWLNKNIPYEEQESFYDDLRRYVGRDDMWSPGPRVRDKNNNVIACKGLLKISDCL